MAHCTTHSVYVLGITYIRQELGQGQTVQGGHITGSKKDTHQVRGFYTISEKEDKQLGREEHTIGERQMKGGHTLGRHPLSCFGVLGSDDGEC